MLFLATDLDGTFLGGKQADRLALYRLLRATNDIRLVFVTGRGLETILPLLDDPLLPDPEFIIADVGATIVHRDGLKPVAPLQWEIDTLWVGVAPVLAALSDLTELERQAVPQERRASFLTDDPALIAEVRHRLASLPVDVLHSAGRYLDVLPRGVNKGSTLARLVALDGVEPAEVLVAGDTSNDLSLFETGFAGVAVGGSEPALLEATRGWRNVHHATAPGAGGILEAIRRHSAELRLPPPPVEPPSGGAQLVVVYHRLPWEERTLQGETIRRRHTSPNGIIPTLLGCFERGRQGSWVAWSTEREPGAKVNHELVDEERYPNLVAAKVALTRQDVERFYKRFSKEAFWPVIFSFVDRARFRLDDWEHFLDVNRRFAEATALEADEGAVVWIHDYNLWMVPGYLRQLRSDLRIGFFHHTAFPAADIFNVIPWAGQILGSLAQCDHIGFHIPRYALNFLDALRSRVPIEVLDTKPCAPRFRIHGGALAVPEMPVRIRSSEREISLGAHPVGVNLRAIHAVLEDHVEQERIAGLSRRREGRRTVLSVERLDYVKGPLQKLEAFELLLDRYPQHRSSVELVFITTPPAPGMEAYDEVREAVDQAVGRINGRFSTLDWTPINYLFRSLPFEEVVRQCATADVAWITPLRDGLNLVAKEFVAAQSAVGGDGVLLLSEFAGAAVEMHGALLTNPYDIEGMCEHLHDALSLGMAERRQRLLRMNAGVARNDVEQWSREFLASLEQEPGSG